MTSREGFDAYCLYLAINNHFNTESYDYFKYHGKVPVKLPSFLKRSDKYHFAKLAREHRDDLRDFLVANLSKQKYYVKSLLDNECEDNYKEFKKKKQKLTYTITEDMRYLYDKYDTLENTLDVVSGQHPAVLKEFLGKKITPETFISFDMMFGIYKKYDNDIQEKFIWPKENNRLKKLKPFIEFEQVKIKKIMREIWIPLTS
ncbi:hypothetical protein N9159_00455 [bacterium]|nr:hypothetical protein [bacterium]|tara:strand:+ start:958 stop:1563 length:606 start_codon:yes stop_codon:yes gene_type:complete